MFIIRLECCPYYQAGVQSYCLYYQARVQSLLRIVAEQNDIRPSLTSLTSFTTSLGMEEEEVDMGIYQHKEEQGVQGRELGWYSKVILGTKRFVQLVGQSFFVKLSSTPIKSGHRKKTHEIFKVNFASTSAYKNSSIP